MLEDPLRVISRRCLTNQSYIVRPVALQNVLARVRVVEVDPGHDTLVYRGGKRAGAVNNSTNLGPDPFLKLRRADARGSLYEDSVVFVLLQAKHVTAGVNGQGPLHEQTRERLEGNMRGEILVGDLRLKLIRQLCVQLGCFVDDGSIVLECQCVPDVAGTWSATFRQRAEEKEKKEIVSLEIWWK